MNEIFWKFPSRRKEERFVALPEDSEGDVVIQSDKSIASINLKTGEGMLNAKGSGSKYFVHLSEALGAEKVKFPKRLVDMLKDAVPHKGDEIAEGSGIYFG